MKQENGRFKPAENTETSACSNKDLKKMFCTTCSVYFDVLRAEFAETKCPTCGNILTDKVE